MNEAQRIDVVDKLFGLKEQQEAKIRKITSPSGKGKRLEGENLPPPILGKSRDKLGSRAKVSGSTYEKGIKIKNSNPELWKECLDNKISIDKASKEIKNKKIEQKIQEQKVEIQKGIKEPDGLFDMFFLNCDILCHGILVLIFSINVQNCTFMSNYALIFNSALFRLLTKRNMITRHT